MQGLGAAEAQTRGDDLVQDLEAAQIDTGNLCRAMPTQCPGFADRGAQLGEFPEAEYVGTHGLHVGVHQGLGPEHIEYFLETLRSFLAENQ